MSALFATASTAAIVMMSGLFSTTPVLAQVASVPTFDRGFADLTKKVNPGVVNISTYVRPKIQQSPMGPYGQGMYGNNDEMFRRFFEEFFGSVPQGRGMRPQGPEDDDGDDDALQPPSRKGSHAKKPKAVPYALGTGFVIDAQNGLILTNHHVIKDAEEVKVQFSEDDEEMIPAEIIGKDPELDVALLKVKTKNLTAIPLGNSDAIDVGEYVIAIGNPMGYGHTVSHGILSAKGRRSPEFRLGRYLQTDASINPGNSGGPLVNMKGEVIGINNAIDARAQGIGFAIPINLVKTILPQLKSKGSVSRGYLGVSAGDLTEEIAEQIQVNPKLKGVLVADVTRGQPAEKAGIRPYDVITAINGEKLTSAQDLTAKITSIPVGETVLVTYVRNGVEKKVSLKVSERPNEVMAAGRGGRPLPSRPKESKGVVFEEFGFRAEALSVENAQVFQIPFQELENKKAVIVTQIADKKPAAVSGLNQGDIILDVGGKPVVTPADLEKKIKSMSGKAIMLRVKRFDVQGNPFVSVVVLKQG